MNEVTALVALAEDLSAFLHRHPKGSSNHDMLYQNDLRLLKYKHVNIIRKLKISHNISLEDWLKDHTQEWSTVMSVYTETLSKIPNRLDQQSTN